MNSLQLDALGVQKMASGHLCLDLSERIGWKAFPDFADKLLQATGGDILKKTDAPNMRLWDVRIDDANLSLVFDDYPVMISLESKDQKGDVVIRKLHEGLAAAQSKFMK